MLNTSFFMWKDRNCYHLSKGIFAQMQYSVYKTDTGVSNLDPWPPKFPKLHNNWPSFFFSARWVVCVSCPQSRLCAAAKHLMARSAVGGAGVTAASASARPLNLGSSTVHAASATTGSVLHIMGKRAMVRTIICVKHCFICILSDKSMTVQVSRAVQAHGSTYFTTWVRLLVMGR